MYNKITIIGLIIFFSSCEGIERKNTFKTIEYDQCEYIYSPYAGFKSLTHKGNCKNH